MDREALAGIEEVSSSWGPWDHFISGYEESERVNKLHLYVNAINKYWIHHSEYGIDPPEKGYVFTCDSQKGEGEIVKNFINAHEPEGGWASGNICIDATGMLIPHLLLFIKLFMMEGVETVDILYTEPQMYRAGEKTTFSKGNVEYVRQIEGYEGVIETDIDDDVCLINVGFDSKLVAEIAEHKDRAEKIRLFGLPSHKADMYQQNVLRSYQASESVGESWEESNEYYFAPANDPFVTASRISEIVRFRKGLRGITNLYLAPLATKPHAIGMALYYLAECEGTATSILFPFCQAYSSNTSIGISRVWKYTVEFSLLRKPLAAAESGG